MERETQRQGFLEELESADEEQSARFRTRNRIFQDFLGWEGGFCSVRARNECLIFGSVQVVDRVTRNGDCQEFGSSKTDFEVTRSRVLKGLEVPKHEDWI